MDTAGVVVARAVSDTAGVFSLPAPRANDLRLYAEALGYLAIVEGPLDLMATDSLQVEVALRPIPTEVAGVSVTVESQSSRLEASGFNRRLAQGQGHHFDRAALLARRKALVVSDWLRGIPGVSVDNVGRVSFGVTAWHRRLPYRVYLDGVLVVVDPMGSNVDWARELVRPSEVEGIEVYTCSDEKPIEFRGFQGSGCGVVVVWTR